MNNLPSNLTRHTVFRDNDYSHTLVFPDTYVLPAVEDMAMQVRRNTVIVDDIDADITKDGQRVTFTYSKEELALIPGYNFQYFLIDGKSILGGELMVVIGVGEQDISESIIEVTEEGITVIEVQGLTLVEDQVALATAAAAEASEWGQQAGDSAINAAASQAAAATSATNASNSATAAATAEANAETAQAAAEAAAQAAETTLADKMDFFSVNTYAQLQAFIADPEVGACAIMVFFDETYGGLPRLHVYTGDVPVLGPKLIQFVTYTE